MDVVDVSVTVTIYVAICVLAVWAGTLCSVRR